MSNGEQLKTLQNQNINLIGDLPFYVSRDSVDVWSNKSLFSIFKNGDLIFQSGVPPDYFSATGQLWEPQHIFGQNIRRLILIGGEKDLKGNLNLWTC